jgi:hypothetical protein
MEVVLIMIEMDDKQKKVLKSVFTSKQLLEVAPVREILMYILLLYVDISISHFSQNIRPKKKLTRTLYLKYGTRWEFY